METKNIWIQLWHKKEMFNKLPDDFLSRIPEYFAKVYDSEFKVEISDEDLMYRAACEQMFCVTQNNNVNNWNGRSTSVGDVMIIMDWRTNVGTSVYKVDHIGFQRLC